MSKTGFSGPLEIGEVGFIGRPLEIMSLSLAVLAQADTPLQLALPACKILRIFQRTMATFTGGVANLTLGSTLAGTDILTVTAITAIASQRSLALQNGVSALLNAWPAGGILYVNINQTVPTAVGAGDLMVEFVRTGN
jgi:hypothetical protein